MFDVLKLGLFFVSRISLPHKIDFHKHTYAFLTMYLVGPPRPWDLQKSPPLVGFLLTGGGYFTEIFQKMAKNGRNLTKNGSFLLLKLFKLSEIIFFVMHLLKDT